MNFLAPTKQPGLLPQGAGALPNDRENSGLEISKPVKMRQAKVFICLVTLKPNWRLKTKFKYTLRNCSIEKQRDELASYLLEQRSKINEFKQYFYNIAFH